MALNSHRIVKWRDRLRWASLVILFVASQSRVGQYLPPAWAPWVGGVASVLFVAAAAWWIGWFVRDQIRDRRAFRTLHEVHVGGRWPLGDPYRVDVDPWDSGARIPHTMRMGERGVEFRPRRILARSFEFAGVDVVRVHASWIEIVSGDESVRVVPRSYADRERMIWELAFRWSAAVDRGIDETPPSVPRPDAIPTATTAATAATGDVPHSGASGLGLASALAGPMDRGNPAPPRKSGLGNGLFVAPPDDAN